VKRGLWIAGALLAVSSTLALAQPKSLLPPGFDNPTPTPSPTPAPRATAAPAPAAAPAAAPVVRPVATSNSKMAGMSIAAVVNEDIITVLVLVLLPPLASTGDDNFARTAGIAVLKL